MGTKKGKYGKMKMKMKMTRKKTKNVKSKGGGNHGKHKGKSKKKSKKIGLLTGLIDITENTENVIKKDAGKGIDFINNNTGKPLNLMTKKSKKGKKGGRKKSKYNQFMKCEITRLKKKPGYKSKKHSLVFKEAAKNWSAKK